MSTWCPSGKKRDRQSPSADAFGKYDNAQGGTQTTGKKALAISILTNNLLLTTYINSVSAGKYFNSVSFFSVK